jgi:hypothetical protein
MISVQLMEKDVKGKRPCLIETLHVVTEESPDDPQYDTL